MGAVHQKISRRFIGRHRNIPDGSQAQQRLHIGIMGNGIERIPKEDQHINLSFGNLRPDLLIGQRISLEESVAALTSMDSFQSLGATVVTRF